MALRRMRGMARAGVALAVLLVGAPAATAADEAMSADVQIAVDTTGSMGPSIAQAKRDASDIVAELRKVVPDVRLSVVEFRDTDKAFAYDYVVRQPFTSSAAEVQAALDTLQAAPTGGAGPAEAHNLVFRNSYTDQTIGWRPEARKFVVVISDAEPHGAGAAGIPGCFDRSVDPTGLNTATELAQMRANKRTLIMVLQTPASTTLDCFTSLAARSYAGENAPAPGANPAPGTGGASPETGGTATTGGGGGNLATPIVGSVTRAFARIGQRAHLRTVRRGRVNAFTITVQNPTRAAARLTQVVATLPTNAFRYVPRSSTGASRANPRVAGRTLIWNLNRALAPGSRVTLTFRVRVPQRPGRYLSRARARVVFPDNRVLTPRLFNPTTIVVRR